MKPVICFIVASIIFSMPGYANNKMFRPVTHKIVPESQGPKLRVLLAEDVNSALIEARGAYRVVDKADGAILSRGSTGKRYVFHAISNGLRWGEEYPDTYQITIKPLNKESSLLVDGIQYKGSITVYQTTKNRISVVNEVPIEELLTSILSVKYDVPLAKEAMAAVAIIERTALYALHAKQKTLVGFDCTKEDLQYHGHGVTRQCLGIEQVVDNTRFMVMEGGRYEKLGGHLSQIEELAHKGLDAKQILNSCYPSAVIGLTTKVPNKIIR